MTEEMRFVLHQVLDCHFNGVQLPDDLAERLEEMLADEGGE